ncbi:hypothetical protein KA005_31565 [bacterium]|nr:hypothetical protein [bacterium]
MSSAIKLNGASETISISLPGWLIELLDDVCEQKDFSRSTFCKRAVKNAILLSKIDDLSVWEKLYKEVQERS